MDRSIGLSGKALASAQHEACRAGARANGRGLGQRLCGGGNPRSESILSSVAASRAPLSAVIVAGQSLPLPIDTAAGAASPVRMVLVAAIASAGRTAGNREPRRLRGQPPLAAQLFYRRARVLSGNDRNRVPWRALRQRGNLPLLLARGASALRLGDKAHAAPLRCRLLSSMHDSEGNTCGTIRISA